MLVSELTRAKMFTILSDSSQNVSLDEMKLAYQDFVENTISICTSNKYMDVFRALNLIHIEITVMKKGEKNVLKQIYLDKLSLFIDYEIELLHLKIQHPEQFQLKTETFKSDLYIIPKSKGLGIIGFVELVVGLFLLGEIYTKRGQLATLSDIAEVFEKMFNFSFGSIFKKKIALFERKPCNLTKLLDNLKILLIKESRKRQNEK